MTDKIIVLYESAQFWRGARPNAATSGHFSTSPPAFGLRLRDDDARPSVAPSSRP